MLKPNDLEASVPRSVDPPEYDAGTTNNSRGPVKVK
jgi:hypothetical protein